MAKQLNNGSAITKDPKTRAETRMASARRYRQLCNEFRLAMRAIQGEEWEHYARWDAQMDKGSENERP